MKKLIVLICLCLFACTSCSKAKQEMELFNTQTAVTISIYEDTLATAEGKEQEIVYGIYSNDLTVPHSDTLDYKDATELLLSNKNDFIESVAVVNSTHFYTRLGLNSVTQITDFLFQGNHYIMQILWVDSKMDMLILEEA